MAEFVINSRTHSTHGLAPFKVTYSYLPSIEQRIEVLREARRDAGAALHLAKRKMKEGFKRGRKKAHQFQVRDHVWLSTEDINLQLSSKKLGD